MDPLTAGITVLVLLYCAVATVVWWGQLACRRDGDIPEDAPTHLFVLVALLWPVGPHVVRAYYVARAAVEWVRLKLGVLRWAARRLVDPLYRRNHRAAVLAYYQFCAMVPDPAARDAFAGLLGKSVVEATESGRTLEFRLMTRSAGEVPARDHEPKAESR